MAKSKTRSRLPLIIVVTAIVLAGVIALLVCTNCFTNWNKYCQWGHDYDEYGVCKRCGEEKPDNAQAEYFQIEAEANGRNIIALSQINRKAYSVMGIPASVESAYTLTATISPSNADNTRVQWSVEFVNPDSEWATGKDPANYVKAQPTVDGSNQATVTCLKAFSEPINVIATSEDNEGAFASCLCDYVKRVVGMDLSISANTLAFGTSYSVNATPQYSDGTIEGEYAVTGYSMTLVSDIASKLNGLQGTYTVNSGIQKITYVATFQSSASRKINLNVDLKEQTFSFKGASPSYVFGTYTTDKSTDGGFVGQSTSSSVVPYASGGIDTEDKYYSYAISAMRSAVDNAFKNAVASVTGTHLVFTFGFTYTYGGNSYVETTATANLQFDAETLAIHVIGLTLDNDHIVFKAPTNSVVV